MNTLHPSSGEQNASMQHPRLHRKLPVALATLAVPALLGLSYARAQDAPPPAAPAELPTARAVVDRYVEVTGAKAMVEKTSSMHVNLTIKIEGIGLSGDVDQYRAKPAKSFEKAVIGSIGTVNTGYDGEVAWVMSAMTGSTVLEGKERFQAVMQAEYDSVLMRPDRYDKLELQGREKFEGKDCYKVLSVYKAPADPEEAKATEKVRTATMWFDVDSGLLIGQKATGAQQGMEIPTTTVFTDYQRYGEYTMAAKATQEQMGQKVSVVVNSVEFDKVDPKVFELPPEVQALLKDAKAPVSAGSGTGGG